MVSPYPRWLLFSNHCCGGKGWDQSSPMMLSRTSSRKWLHPEVTRNIQHHWPQHLLFWALYVTEANICTSQRITFQNSLVCYLPLGKIQLPDGVVREGVTDKRNILKRPIITLSLFHIQRECTEHFPRPKHSWRCKNTWKIWNQVQSLYLGQLKMGRNELFCVNCYNFCAMPLNVKKVSVTLVT